MGKTMHHHMSLLLLVGSLLFASGCAHEARPTPSSSLTETGNRLVGAWEVQEVHWRHEKTPFSIDQAQPGLFIFADNHYSIMWTPINKPRTAFKVLSEPTDAEAIAGFKSVVFNGGSYEYTDTTLTSTAAIAKVPGFEGGKQFYRYVIVGDTLTLTMLDEIYPDGTKPAWSGEYQTEFVLRRAR